MPAPSLVSSDLARQFVKVVDEDLAQRPLVEHLRGHAGALGDGRGPPPAASRRPRWSPGGGTWPQCARRRLRRHTAIARGAAGDDFVVVLPLPPCPLGGGPQARSARVWVGDEEEVSQGDRPRRSILPPRPCWRTDACPVAFHPIDRPPTVPLVSPRIGQCRRWPADTSVILRSPRATIRRRMRRPTDHITPGQRRWRSARSEGLEPPTF